MVYFRELYEESGLTVTEDNLDHVGVLTFEFVNDPVLMEVHVYRTETFNGSPIETEGGWSQSRDYHMTYLLEMRPQWFEHEKIPYDNMWPDDLLWYPLMLNGKYFNGYFKFEGITTLLDYTINEQQLCS